MDCDAQELGYGSVSFGQNVALELGLPFEQYLSCDFPKLGVLHFTIFKWILGWGLSAELSISVLYKAGATLLQLFCPFFGCIYHQTCRKKNVGIVTLTTIKIYKICFKLSSFISLPVCFRIKSEMPSFASGFCWNTSINYI